ncbi:MAG: ABC transporter ATP-binding protein [Ruminococcus sp.]|nr:ABC transporter ATP-binding protein [Ruminococcus sp.]
MKKLLQHFKPSIGYILLIILLLIIRSYGELSLPTYTSDIVNVGIQQGGIEEVAPQKAPKNEIDKIKLFMSVDDAEFFDSLYKSDTYKGTKILVLNDNINEKQKTKLNNLLEKPMLITYMLEKAQDGTLDKNSISGDMKSSDETQKLIQDAVSKMTPENQLKFANIMAENSGKTPDILSILPLFDDKTRSEITKSIDKQLKAFDELGDDTVKQVVVPYTKSLMETAGVDTDEIRIDYLYRAAFVMLGYCAVILVCMILISLIAGVVGARFARDIRSHAYNSVINFSPAETEKFSNASLITRCTNDIQQIQFVLVMTLKMIFYAPIIGIGAVLKVVNVGSGMVWVVAMAVGIIIALVAVLMIVAMPKFTALQKLIDKLNLVSREILTGLPVIRAFSREKYEEKRFDKANTNLTNTNLFVNRVMSVMMPLMMFIMNGVSVLIVWVGVDQIDSGSMQVGDIMAYIQYTMQVIISFLMICMASIVLPRAIISAKRLGEIFDTEITISDCESPKEFSSDKQGLVEFDNVSFKYPGASESVLSNITFTAEPGKTTAIIGSTGSGKSTLVNLIPRFFDITDGSLRVDGVDVSKVKLSDLRGKIGYVPQKGILFTGTVSSNIAYADENLSMEKIKKAAEIAHADEFIKEKPQGYDTLISQGGTNVSGGQRQRLSIARAIAAEPEILIFDDSFSALDFKTDSAVRKSLAENIKESTIIIVAQRISTVLNAEQIIVLDNGKIVGKGTHSELMKNCEVYRDIAESQLSKEELQ